MQHQRLRLACRQRQSVGRRAVLPDEIGISSLFIRIEFLACKHAKLHQIAVFQRHIVRCRTHARIHDRECVVEEIGQVLAAAPEFLEIERAEAAAGRQGVGIVRQRLPGLQIIRLQHPDHQMQHCRLLHDLAAALHGVRAQTIRLQIEPADLHRYGRQQRMLAVIARHIDTVLRQGEIHILRALAAGRGPDDRTVRIERRVLGKGRLRRHGVAAGLLREPAVKAVVPAIRLRQLGNAALAVCVAVRLRAFAAVRVQRDQEAFALPREHGIAVVAERRVLFIACDRCLAVQLRHEAGQLHLRLRAQRRAVGLVRLGERPLVEAALHHGDVLIAAEAAERAAAVHGHADITRVVAAKRRRRHIDLARNAAQIVRAGDGAGVIAAANDGIVLHIAHNTANVLRILRADLAPVAAVVNVSIGARARNAADPLTARNCRIAAAAFHLIVQAHAAHNAADLQAAADRTLKRAVHNTGHTLRVAHHTRDAAGLVCRPGRLDRTLHVQLLHLAARADQAEEANLILRQLDLQIRDLMAVAVERAGVRMARFADGIPVAAGQRKVVQQSGRDGRVPAVDLAGEPVQLRFLRDLIHAADIRRLRAVRQLPEARVRRRRDGLRRGRDRAGHARARDLHGQPLAHVVRRDGIGCARRAVDRGIAAIPLVVQRTLFARRVEGRRERPAHDRRAADANCPFQTHDLAALGLQDAGRGRAQRLELQHPAAQCLGDGEFVRDRDDHIVALAVAVIPDVDQLSFRAGIHALDACPGLQLAVDGKLTADGFLFAEQRQNRCQLPARLFQRFRAADGVVRRIAVILKIAAGHVAAIVEPHGVLADVQADRAAGAAAERLHVPGVVRAVHRAVVPAHHAADIAAHDRRAAHDRAVVRAVFHRAIRLIRCRNARRHHAARADESAVRAAAHCAAIFRGHTRDSLRAAYRRPVQTAGDRAAVSRGDTGSPAAAAERALGGAALDRPGVDRRQNGALVAADDLAGDGEVLDRAAVRGEQRRSPHLILAVEVCDAVARAVQLAREVRVHGRPVAVVEVDVLRQDAFDGAVGLDRIGEPFQLRRRPDLVDAIRLRGDGSFFAVPAVRIALGPVGILRLGRSRILPFEDGIAAVLGLCIGLEIIAKFFRRQRFQFVRRLALGRAVLDGTIVEIADRLQIRCRHIDLIQRLLAARPFQTSCHAAGTFCLRQRAGIRVCQCAGAEAAEQTACCAACPVRRDLAGVVATVDRTVVVYAAGQAANQTRTRYGAGIIARQHGFTKHVAGYAAYVAAARCDGRGIGTFADGMIHISCHAAHILCARNRDALQHVAVLHIVCIARNAASVFGCAGNDAVGQCQIADLAARARIAEHSGALCTTCRGNIQATDRMPGPVERACITLVVIADWRPFIKAGCVSRDVFVDADIRRQPGRVGHFGVLVEPHQLVRRADEICAVRVLLRRGVRLAVPRRLHRQRHRRDRDCRALDLEVSAHRFTAGAGDGIAVFPVREQIAAGRLRSQCLRRPVLARHRDGRCDLLAVRRRDRAERDRLPRQRVQRHIGHIVHAGHSICAVRVCIAEGAGAVAVGIAGLRQAIRPPVRQRRLRRAVLVGHRQHRVRRGRGKHHVVQRFLQRYGDALPAVGHGERALLGLALLGLDLVGIRTIFQMERAIFARPIGRFSLPDGQRRRAG